MDLVISEDNLCIEFDQVLDDDFEKISSVRGEVATELNQVFQVNSVNINGAQLVRIIFPYCRDYIFTLDTLSQHLLKAAQSLGLCVTTEKPFNGQVVDHTRGLPTSRPVKSADF